MKKQVLFIHGGGDGGYDADAKLAASLQQELGKDYEVTYPQMPWHEEDDPNAGWSMQIGEEIGKLKGSAIWAGHSVGASLLLKYLSENKILHKTPGIFLVAPPFWSGKEEWKQELILRKDFAANLPKDIPVFFYHCEDDDVVPTDHITTYRQHLPNATFREFESGGHQLNNDLNPVAKDIKNL